MGEAGWPAVVGTAWNGVVAPAGAEGAVQQALECGAAGIVERPLDAAGLRHALAAAGCFDTRPPAGVMRVAAEKRLAEFIAHENHVV